MSDRGDGPTVAAVTDALAAGDASRATTCLEALRSADEATRKVVLRGLRDAAADTPGAFDGVVPALSSFLDDGSRAVRLTAAKTLVELARGAPDVVVPAVDAIAGRVGDDEEFYYVRARCAEALGYVGRDHPQAVSDPGTLADLRVGLAFDEPAVREKLAKALACVALGDPSRLKHGVESLAEHLADDRDLVRYHVATALVVVGCEHPAKLAGAADALAGRSSDENAYVRGRAAEALGLLAATAGDGVADGNGHVDADAFASGPDGDDQPAFLTDRVAFLRGRVGDEAERRADPDGVGTVDSVRERTDAVVDEMTSPDGDACSGCGLTLPPDAPPMCPRCGAPR